MASGFFKALSPARQFSGAGNSDSNSNDGRRRRRRRRVLRRQSRTSNT